MRLAIDLDGVVFPFQKKFTRFCEAKFKISPLPEITHWSFAKSWNITETQYRTAFLDFVFTAGFRKGEPIHESKTMLTDLYNDGHEIYFVSSRGTELSEYPKAQKLVREDTLEWLYKEGFQSHGVLFLRQKDLFMFDVLLDDAPRHLEESPYRAVAFDAPWNREWKGPRVRSWLEFKEYIRKMEEV